MLLPVSVSAPNSPQHRLERFHTRMTRRLGRRYPESTHTHKAQESNTEPFFQLLNLPSAPTSQPDPLRPTLMDEVLTDESDKRSVECRRVRRRSGSDVLLARARTEHCPQSLELSNR